jgi:hypothetical protein
MRVLAPFGGADLGQLGRAGVRVRGQVRRYRLFFPLVSGLGLAALDQQFPARPGRAPGSRVIAFATWLLVLLGAGLMYVSFDAQYQFILAQKGARAASLIEAAMLDAGMVILSALGIGLAQAGKPSRSVRFLIMICAGASAGMNLAAADPAS